MGLQNLIDQMGTIPMTGREAGDRCRDLAYTAKPKYAAYCWNDPKHAGISSFKLPPNVQWPKCKAEYVGKDGPWHHFHTDESIYQAGTFPKHLKCCLCGYVWEAERSLQEVLQATLLHLLTNKLLQDELGF